jgi:hypothetical protein
MSHLNLFPRILLMAAMAFAGAAAAEEDVAWIADKNGCKVANPFPQAGETITWSGACKKGLADGQGVLQWFVNGKLFDRYEGTLQEGWAEGNGTLTRGDGSRYTGHWKHSLQDGDGRYEATDGSWYAGQWKAGKPHGRGQYQSADGRRLEGEWVDGEFQDDEDDGDEDRDDKPGRT